MNYNEEVFRFQYPLIKSCTLHLQLFRSLASSYKESNVFSEFWNYTINAHLLRAINLWCMVFGSEGNEIHWKKLAYNEDKEKLEGDFRSRLLKETDFSWKDWSSFHKEVLDFRNVYASHMNYNDLKPVPSVEKMLKIIFFYDEWVRDLIRPDTFDEPLLKDSISGFKEHIEQFIPNLFSVSARFDKERYSGFI